MFDGALICERKTAVPLNLTKSPSAFSTISITPLIQGKSPRRILPYEFNTLEKQYGDSIDHVAETMCSISDVFSVEKELKDSSSKNEEN